MRYFCSNGGIRTFDLMDRHLLVKGKYHKARFVRGVGRIFMEGFLKRCTLCAREQKFKAMPILTMPSKY